MPHFTYFKEMFQARAVLMQGQLKKNLLFINQDVGNVINTLQGEVTAV